MDGLDGLMLRQARPAAADASHRTLDDRSAGFESILKLIELGGRRVRVGEAPRDKGVAAVTVNAESPPVGGLSAIRRSGGFRGKGTFR